MIPGLVFHTSRALRLQAEAAVGSCARTALCSDLGRGKKMRVSQLCEKLFVQTLLAQIRRIKDSFPRIHSRVWSNNCSNIKIFLRLLICADKSLPRNFVLIYTHASCT